MEILVEDTLQEGMGAVDFGATPVGAIRFGQGHINDTFVPHTDRGRKAAATLFCSISARCRT